MGRVIVVLALLLAGCKAPEKPWAFFCPEPGGRVAWDDGRSLEFLDSEAPLCKARLAAGGRETALVFGMVETTASEGTGHAKGMAELFPARPGGQARYTATVSSPGSGIQYPFDTRWRVIGFEKVTVPAGGFEAVVFERAVAGTGANAAQTYTVRYWLDRASALPLKRAVEIGRGGSTVLHSFEAKEVAPAPRRDPAARGAPRSG